MQSGLKLIPKFVLSYYCCVMNSGTNPARVQLMVNCITRSMNTVFERSKNLGASVQVYIVYLVISAISFSLEADPNLSKAAFFFFFLLGGRKSSSSLSILSKFTKHISFSLSAAIYNVVMSCGYRHASPWH